VPDTASIIQEQVTFGGTAGCIEATLTYPEQDDPTGAVLIVGPHPMLGGDYDNNVVSSLATRLAENTFLTLRFNYRGVGGSAGATVLSTDNIADFWAHSKIDDETGFAEDAATAGEFLRTAFGCVSHVAGYSFGAWLGSRWACEIGGVESVTLIAPTISQHDYSHLTISPTPKLVVASSDDFAVPADDLRQQFSTWSAPKRLILEQVDNHFFRGHETWLAETVALFLRGES